MSEEERKKELRAALGIPETREIKSPPGKRPGSVPEPEKPKVKYAWWKFWRYRIRIAEGVVIYVLGIPLNLETVINWGFWILIVAFILFLLTQYVIRPLLT